MAPHGNDSTILDPSTPTAPRPRRRLRGDVGAILLSSVVKFVVIVAILGVIGYDSLSIARTQVTLRDDAGQAAQIAHDAVTNGQSPAAAYAQAVAYAKAHGATITKNGFSIAPDSTVTVTMTETAKTFVAGRIPSFAQYVSPVVTVTAARASI